MTGRALGVSDSQQTCKYVNFPYTSAVVTQAIFIANFPCRLVSIRGRVRVDGSGGACTFSFYKCASGVAAASGTLLHAGSFNLVGGADVNQSLTLVAPTASRDFIAGDSLNLVLTGTATSAVGLITATFDPL